ncbi:DUF4166 domain-containing protein, partial [Wolbachia endosymbiont of Pentidionis agamae]|uniref:DUF4166 domain-containing protein n=1 Tax=Wolbachia endosymbiont of Pentidionis agamae TaxID=3110435 RepID=UPI002FD394F6
FANVFKKQWKNLPLAIKKRYVNRSYSNDVVTVKGKLNVHCSWVIYLLKPLLKIFNTLVPYQGKDIPVTVNLTSKSDSNLLHFNRTFYFPHKEYHFRSRMMVMKDNSVIEFMRFNLGWHMNYFYDGKKVIMEHRRYVWKICKFLIPLPLSLILGKGYAEEEALSDNEFRMYFEIRHKLFGKVYGYDGNFIIREDQDRKDE